MRHSSDRILATHVGSLPAPRDLWSLAGLLKDSADWADFHDFYQAALEGGTLFEQTRAAAGGPGGPARTGSFYPLVRGFFRAGHWCRDGYTLAPLPATQEYTRQIRLGNRHGGTEPPVRHGIGIDELIAVALDHRSLPTRALSNAVCES